MIDLNDFWKDRISGKKVLITGGTTGIGREITILLARLGAHCFICGRNQAPLDETIAAVKILTTANHCNGLVADLANEEDIKRIFVSVEKELGGLDILVNNAALPFGGITEGTYADWDYLLRSNLLSYIACSNYALNMGNLSHIVNIGSMSADVRETGSSLYVASKSGIQGFSEALRKELNPKGIKVILIEPGATDTDMQEFTKEEKEEKIRNLEMLKAEDVAISVAFALAQPERSDIVNLQIRPHLQLI
ncbi:SDR family oxidoreductase [Daejeonella lutea]|uniref:NAD(P)-dependent dehydrogenase, short-chain alcohol dehydrogenase family n=1 Tax=Daejeonella lutea TaxID=572036 RepID=A0A1T5CW82_9SPHI|nr:SDR family oxidoreductase [Daejeonella lutea]SKB63798.1 NAD(P)-dependent dehydrogenase, short-chain alcohol dehydrogenase family [Daejeonella lutea]